jgi:uncharacterized membrane protein YdjX (TVP38/TMEM64 family)
MYSNRYSNDAETVAAGRGRRSLTGCGGGRNLRAMSSNEHGEKQTQRRRRLAILLAGGLALIVAAVAALFVPKEMWVQAKEAVRAAVEWVRHLGAEWFFAAFAVLPAVGFPVSVFPLAAGPLFVPVLGLPTVLLLSSACMAISMTISYALARYVVRPWVTRLLGYLGYKIPVVPAEKQRMFTVLVRITPGPPYVFQSFLLGLAEVSFGTYLLISWAISSVNVALFVIFGDALAQGKGKVALIALAGVVMVVVGVKLLRDRIQRRERAAAGVAAAPAGEDI